MVNCLGTGEATPPEFTNSGSWPLSFLSAYNRHKFVAWSFSETLAVFYNYRIRKPMTDLLRILFHQIVYSCHTSDI